MKEQSHRQRIIRQAHGQIRAQDHQAHFSSIRQEEQRKIDTMMEVQALKLSTYIEKLQGGCRNQRQFLTELWNIYCVEQQLEIDPSSACKLTSIFIHMMRAESKDAQELFMIISIMEKYHRILLTDIEEKQSIVEQEVSLLERNLSMKLNYAILEHLSLPELSDCVKESIKRKVGWKNNPIMQLLLFKSLNSSEKKKDLQNILTFLKQQQAAEDLEFRKNCILLITKLLRCCSVDSMQILHSLTNPILTLIKPIFNQDINLFDRYVYVLLALIYNYRGEQSSDLPFFSEQYVNKLLKTIAKKIKKIGLGSTKDFPTQVFMLIQQFCLMNIGNTNVILLEIFHMCCAKDVCNNIFSHRIPETLLLNYFKSYDKTTFCFFGYQLLKMDASKKDQLRQRLLSILNKCLQGCDNPKKPIDQVPGLIGLLRQSQQSNKIQIAELSRNLVCLYEDRPYLPNTEKLSLNAQRVFLVVRIVQCIAQPHINRIEDMSLSERLQALIKEDDTVCKSIKQQIMSLFTEGINNDHPIFKQNRIQQQKFAFFPNSITSFIFQTLLADQGETMIIAPKGMSKSTAIMLYIILIGYVYQYSQYIKQDYYLLYLLQDGHYKLNIVDIMNKKYWYLNVSWLKENRFQDAIVDQATELPENVRQYMRQCHTMQELAQCIKEYYPPSTSHITIVDEADQANSFKKLWNQFVLENALEFQKACQIQDDIRSEQLLQLQAKIQRFNKENSCKRKDVNIVNDMLAFTQGMHFYAISPYCMSSEYQFLKQTLIREFHQFRLPDKYQPLGKQLFFELKQRFLRMEFISSKELYTKFAFNIRNYIIFQFGQTLRRLNVDYRWFEESKKILLQASKKVIIHKNYSYALIKDYLNDQKIIDQLTKCFFTSPKDITLRAVSVLNGLEAYFKRLNQAKLNAFLEEGNKQLKLKLLRFLVVYAGDLIKKNKADFKHQLQYSKAILGQQILIDSIFCPTSQTDQTMKIKCIKTESQLALVWSPQQFTIFAKGLAYQSLEEKFQKEQKINREAVSLQNLLMLLMKPSAVLSFCIPFDKASQVRWERVRFQVYKKLNFDWQNYVNDDCRIESILRQILQDCKKNPDKWIFGVPTQLITPTNEFLSNCSSSDYYPHYLLVKYTQLKQKYEVLVFSQNLEPLSPYIQDFEKQLSILTEEAIDIGTVDFQIKLILFVPFDQSEEIQIINKLLTICYSSIFQITMQNHEQPELLKTFNEVKNLIKRIRIFERSRLPSHYQSQRRSKCIQLYRSYEMASVKQ